jgi:hypothetical protein
MVANVVLKESMICDPRKGRGSGRGPKLQDGGIRFVTAPSLAQLSWVLAWW